ncbi:hypothetical protein C8Q74DRAFT_1266025 [Fomes fomentarius]|nr:hypothetical protein C8Q74DRAFT_1266025 [Fomes fomentarius]
MLAFLLIFFGLQISVELIGTATAYLQLRPRTRTMTLSEERPMTSYSSSTPYSPKSKASQLERPYSERAFGTSAMLWSHESLLDATNLPARPEPPVHAVVFAQQYHPTRLLGLDPH